MEPLRAAGLEVRTYDSVADIMRDVSLGRIQAPASATRRSSPTRSPQGTFRGVRLIPDYRPSVVGSIVAIGMRKGDPVMARSMPALAR